MFITVSEILIKNFDIEYIYNHWLYLYLDALECMHDFYKHITVVCKQRL